MEYKCNLEWYKSYSHIKDVLFTQIVRQTECIHCKYYTINIENVPSLNINIPSTSKTDTVQNCIDQYFNNIDVEDWKCDKCNRVNNKPLVIQKTWYLPNVLVLCIKRFKFVNNKAVKINTHIDIPEYIDLEKHSLKIYNNCKYKLSAIVNHSGTSFYGHYTCDLIKTLYNILHIDDDRVTNVTKKSIQNKNCYIILYNRVT